uniref:FNIPrepeat containing protein n=1 Tax=Megaviridae environmental sample TaxID=1737588 RepID=A0A5J6VHX6_9VIRU|nr:MAG: FNIPrepeat containing protein [Megaviridae environmental sample]
MFRHIIDSHNQYECQSIKELNNSNGTLSDSVIHLKLTRKFNSPIEDIRFNSNIKKITFHPESKFNYVIPIQVLPCNLIELRLPRFFNKIIIPGILPESLRILTFGHNYNYEILPHALPSKLYQLEFDGIFNKVILPNILPANLKNLIFGSGFNQSIDGILPNLEILKLGVIFNQRINVLPDTLKRLTLSKHYNHSIDGIIPDVLHYLDLGCNFNQMILPNTLKNVRRLIISNAFNQPLTCNVLPDDLETLYFASFSKFNNEIVIPSNIKHIKFRPFSEFDSPLHHVMQCNSYSKLTHLDLSDHFNQELTWIPESVRYLKLGWEFNSIIHKQAICNLQKLEFGIRFNKPLNNILSNKLEELILGYEYRQPLTDLPPSLKYLVVFTDLDLVLPPNIKTLYLGGEFNHVIDMPLTLLHLQVGNSFNQPLADLNIIQLKTGQAFNHPIDHLTKLIMLELGDDFDQPICKLPNNLETLIITHSYSWRLPKLPDSLITLELANNYHHELDLPLNLFKLRLGYEYPHQIDAPGVAMCYLLNRTLCPHIDMIINEKRGSIIDSYWHTRNLDMIMSNTNTPNDIHGTILKYI